MALINCQHCKTEVATDAKTCPKCNSPNFKPPQKGSALGGFLIIGLVVFGGIKMCGGDSEPVAKANAAPAPKAEPVAEKKEVKTAEQEKAENAKFEACRAKLIKAQKLGMLHDLDWKAPREPKVVAGSTFFQVPIDAKEGMAETINCFLMTGGSGHISFDVLHWQTGKPVGRYSWGKFKMN